MFQIVLEAHKEKRADIIEFVSTASSVTIGALRSVLSAASFSWLAKKAILTMASVPYFYIAKTFGRIYIRERLYAAAWHEEHPYRTNATENNY